MMTARRVRPEKVQAVENIKSMLQGYRAFYFVDFTGWTVAEITELRRQLRESNARMKVVKNTLLRIALNQMGIDKLDEYLFGPTALVISYADEVQPLKVVHKFIKDTEKGRLKLAYLSGEVFVDEKLEQLVKLPSIEEIRAKVVGGVSAPLYGLMYSLSGLLTNLLNVLNQIKDKKGE